MKLRDVLAELVEGQWAWPGGYPKYFILADGETASYAGIQAEIENVARACASVDRRSFYRQWLPVAVDINYEDDNLFCCITNDRIPSAYSENE